MWKNQYYKRWAFQPWDIGKEYVPIFQRWLSNTPFKTLHEKHRPLQLYCYCPRGLEQKNSLHFGLQQEAFWKVDTGTKYSAGSEGFDVSAVPTSQSEAHIQSAGCIQLLTHTPLTVSNLLMWDPWCSTEKIVTGARNYPLKKQTVWKGIWSLPQTNRPALSVCHTFDINRGI